MMYSSIYHILNQTFTHPRRCLLNATTTRLQRAPEHDTRNYDRIRIGISLSIRNLQFERDLF